MAQIFDYRESEIEKNCIDLKKINAIGKRVMMVCAEEGLLRGIDYRNRKGIALLIATTLSSQRAYTQCCGRVGRNGERKARFKLKGVEDYEKGRELELAGKLSKRMTELKLERKKQLAEKK